MSEQIIKAIEDYFGISRECAQYLYYRAYRGKRADPTKYLKFNLQLQNAIVLADKALGINWNEIHFGNEYHDLIKFGILVEYQSEDTVFRWNQEVQSEWITVVNKKSKRNQSNQMILIKKPGLFI